MKKIEFDIRIDPDGTWSVLPGMREMVQKYFGLSELPIFLKMIFTGRGKIRSLDQNAYYWKVVIPMITAGFIRLGNKLRIGRSEDYEKVHNLMKDKFAKDDLFAVFNKFGEELSFREKTTTNMSTREFNRYVRDVVDFGLEYLDVNIPEPNKRVIIFDEEGKSMEVTVEDFLLKVAMDYEA